MMRSTGLLTDNNILSEDYCDPESEYLKFLSSLSAFVQMNNGTSNNEDELLLDDEEDCTDILNDDEEEEEEDPLEEYRDDPDVLVSDSELRELFEDEELEDMQNWAPAEENQKLLVFDNR
jgi:hypothetical protein